MLPEALKELGGAEISSRLFNKRRFSGDCWEWTGAKQSTGYGMIKLAGKPYLVHRVAAGLWFPGFTTHKVTQTCQNKLCFNPKHFVLDTPAKAKSYTRKLTPEAVAQAKKLYAKDSKANSIGVLARQFGCSYACMWQALSGNTWKDKGNVVYSNL